MSDCVCKISNNGEIISYCGAHWHWAKRMREKAEAERDTYQEALKWYGDIRNWTTKLYACPVCGLPVPILNDNGKRARKALEEKPYERDPCDTEEAAEVRDCGDK